MTEADALHAHSKRPLLLSKGKKQVCFRNTKEKKKRVMRSKWVENEVVDADVNEREERPSPLHPSTPPAPSYQRYIHIQHAYAQRESLHTHRFVPPQHTSYAVGTSSTLTVDSLATDTYYVRGQMVSLVKG